MNMQNPYEDLIKIIDIVLRKIELEPASRSYLFQSFDLPPLKGTVQVLFSFLENLKAHGAIENLEKGSGGLLFYITKPNKQQLLAKNNILG